MKPNKELRSWLIVLVVLATAFITSWAMLRYQPSQDRNGSYYYPPHQVAQNFSPGIAAMERSWQLAAGTTAIPVIRAGAVAPHTDRGICIHCHTVVGRGQQPIPPISASATMPHEFRGVCSNCHRLPNPSGFNPDPYRGQAATPVAAMWPVAAPRTVTPARTAMPARVPTEGEWMGMEVTPITALTARQYAIRDGTRGLVVAEAEVPAATAGIRAGDVIVSVNGVPVTQMTDFFQATRNGTLTGGVVEIVRQGQRLAVNLAQTTNPALARVPNTPIDFPRAAMPTPRGNFSMAPANADAWGGGQGTGVAGGSSSGVGWQRQF